MQFMCVWNIRAEERNMDRPRYGTVAVELLEAVKVTAAGLNVHIRKLVNQLERASHRIFLTPNSSKASLGGCTQTTSNSVSYGCFAAYVIR